jgi:hypothetical protein
MSNRKPQKFDWYFLIRDRQTRLWKHVHTSDSAAAIRRLRKDSDPILVIDKSLGSAGINGERSLELHHLLQAVIHVDQQTNEIYTESDWEPLDSLDSFPGSLDTLLKMADEAEKREDEAPERARLAVEAIQKKEIAAFTSKKIWPRFWIYNKTKITGLSGCLFMLLLCGLPIFIFIIISRIHIALVLLVVTSALFYSLVRDHREDKERISSIKSRINNRQSGN